LASTTSPEASEIRRRGRRRLIGAIALVMLLVVFVPMLLDPEPRPARSGPTLAIPPKDNPPPLPAPTPPAPVSSAPAKVEVAAASPKVEPVAAAPVAVAPAQAGAQSPLEGFAVQVGAFRDETKLAQSREKLAAAGVVHYTERLDSKGGPLTRLRAGPFPTREAAEAALAKLKRASLDGKVVPLAAEREERKR
jgi:DedD protein